MTIGSAGTLVAAGLATAGQYLQSRLLDLLALGIQNQLMVFLFVIAALGGFTIIAIGGRTRAGYAMILGPFLAYTCLMNRVETTGVAWRLGSTMHDDSKVSAVFTGVYNEGAGTDTSDPDAYKVRVSWIFSLWDQLTSSMANLLVTLLQRADIRPDMTFLARTQKLSSMFKLGVVDSELERYLHGVFFPKCSAWIDLELLKARPEGLLTPEEIARRSLEVEEQIVLSRGEPAHNLISDLNARGYFASPPGEIYDKYTCRDLWHLAVDAMKIQAYKSTAMLAAEETPDGLSSDEMFWALVGKFGEDGTASQDDVYQMLNTISARMLMTAVQQRSRGFARADYLNPVERAIPRPSIEQKDPYDIVRDVRESAGTESDSEQGAAFGLIVGLPYLQGVLLVLLSLSFPIVAILLVYPGRAHQMLVWMSLWLWVKLWDFGFAVVMLIDELLWSLLPRPPVVSEAQLNAPSSAFAALLSGDPTYSVAVYWDLMSMLIAAVPIITGVVVHRAGRGLLSVSTSALNQYSRQLRGGFFNQGERIRAKISPPGENKASNMLKPVDRVRLTQREPSVFVGLPPVASPPAQPPPQQQSRTAAEEREPEQQLEEFRAMLNLTGPSPHAQKRVTLDPKLLLLDPFAAEASEESDQAVIEYKPGGPTLTR